MTILVALAFIVTCLVAKFFYDQSVWFQSRLDYWYEQSRFWQEMWEAERSGDYARLAEIRELRKMEDDEAAQ